MSEVELGRTGLHWEGIRYTVCPLKLAQSTNIYNNIQEDVMDYGNCVSVCGCVYPACRDVHVFICYSMLMVLIWAHVDMVKCLHACMNVYSSCGWMCTSVCVCVCVCVESLKCLRLNTMKLWVRAQWLKASMLRWLCINAAVALFSYLGFRANVWKVHIFNGNSEGTINSQGAVFLSPSHNESSRGQTSPSEGGVGCEKSSVGVGGRGLIVVSGDIREGCNCTGHVAIWEELLWDVHTHTQKKEPLSEQWARCLSAFPSEIQSSWVWIFSSKMAPSSITHYKPHDSFHCAILNLTRLR